MVLIGWQYFFVVPQMEKQRAQQARAADQAGGDSPAQPRPAAPATPQPGAPRRAQRARRYPAAPRRRPCVSREAAIAASPRVKIDTPKLSGSIALKGGRIDDVSLMQYRETVDPKSPAIILFSPSRHRRTPITPNSAGSAPPARRCECPTRTRCGSRKAATR